jgi:hypothetical protein
VNEISEWTLGVNNLRVCWQGELEDRNCGVCEKCIRTKLNFLATGSSIPSCFPETEFPVNFNKVELKNDAVLAEWRQIYEYATRKKIHESWVNEINKAINRRTYSIVDIMFPKGSIRRTVAKNIIKKLGIY